MAKDKADSNIRNQCSSTKDSKQHFYLALIIIVSSLILIAGIITGILIVSHNRDEASQLIVTSFLPLIGAWVGAVIAFYFSSKNLESATNSVQRLVGQVTPQEKLKAIPVKDKMIQKKNINFEVLPANNIVLFDAIEKLKKSGKGQRIPVIDENGCIKYIMHRSKIEEFLTKRALAALKRAKEAPGSIQSGQIEDPEKITLDILLNEDPGLKWLFETSFGTVAETATLADVKKVMDSTPMCQDVFVTKSGAKDEEVTGWITNVIIEENCKI